MSIGLWMPCVVHRVWELLGSRDPTSAHPVGPQGQPQGSPASPSKPFSSRCRQQHTARAELCLSSGCPQGRRRSLSATAAAPQLHKELHQMSRGGKPKMPIPALPRDNGAPRELCTGTHSLPGCSSRTLRIPILR